MTLSPAKWSAAALLLLAAGASAPAQQPSHYAQVVIREQIVVKMRTRAQPPQQIRWKESKGPKCIPARAIGGAAVISEDSIDLILRDNRRIRVKLDGDCPALGYYPGFYVTPNPDGMICAGRDSIRSRIGGRCGIDRFRTLQPVIARKKD
ncbi:hypothetical protein [Sphingosinicella sp. BN140058]|uniref:hypothetical protein n=1 Tax=Sphingosinicella sp. BN140058 TaxID=1892855 RepID=UPI001012A48E|nr:hypothetical protein [Sphingosinicella sp. BN140058]QAY75258.1 hypothetical protein ETR14_00960 [Sphingosinicella sp. BN140058]